MKRRGDYLRVRVTLNDAVIQMTDYVWLLGLLIIVIGWCVVIRTRKKPEKKWDWRDNIPYPEDGPRK